MDQETLGRLEWQPVAPSGKPVLFVNPRSGDGTSARVDLPARARALGIEVIIFNPGDNREEMVTAAVDDGADALGMAGGDGSLALVAGAAAANGLPFVCVPAGTRNHFARDVGIERHDVLGSLDAFTDAVERPVDLAEVNGRPFLNNVSLGVYAEAVRREGYRDAKARSLMETAQSVLAPGGTALTLRVVDDVGLEHDKLAVVLVSNNPYALDRLPPGTRPALDGGLLGVIVLDAPDPGTHPPGRAWTTRHLDLVASERVRAAIDGEAVELDPRLSFAIRPKGLRVRISRRHPGVPPSASLPPLRPRVRDTGSPRA